MPETSRGPFPFTRPYFWSLQKLEILEKYAAAAATIIGSYRPITFVDLMAGEGYYETGEAGSTGRLASIAQASASAGRRVRCIAYEADASAFAALEANTQQARDFVTVRHARWETDVDGLLRELGNDFAFFFVDPMGLRQIPWVALEPLATRGSSELFVNFASTTGARLVGKWRNGGSTAEGDARRLDNVYGARSFWADRVSGASTVTGELHHLLAAAYATRLKEAGGYLTAWLPVLHGGNSGRPKYHLIFASRNRDRAFGIMNDILAAQTQRLQLDALERMESQQRQPRLFPFDRDSETKASNQILVQRLADSLTADATLRGRSMTLDQLFTHAFETRFGAYKRTIYRQAADVLKASGRLEVLDQRLTWQAKVRLL